MRQLIGESDPQGDILQIPLAEVERRHILRVLASTGGNKTKAARRLGIDTKTLYNKLKAYGAAAAAQRRRDDGRATADSRFPSPVAKPASECSSCGNPVVTPAATAAYRRLLQILTTPRRGGHGVVLRMADSVDSSRGIEGRHSNPGDGEA